MKNSITKHGAEALKIMLDNTSLIDAELDMMKGLVDIMTGEVSFDEKRMKSQSEMIKKHRAEIELLKRNIKDQQDAVIYSEDKKAKEIIRLNKIIEKENQFIQSGDFMLTKDDGIFKTHYRGESKTISEADVAKKLRELYFRTEEKRCCETCYLLNDRCAWNQCGKDLKLWKPKTKED